VGPSDVFPYLFEHVGGNKVFQPDLCFHEILPDTVASRYTIPVLDTEPLRTFSRKNVFSLAVIQQHHLGPFVKSRLSASSVLSRLPVSTVTCPILRAGLRTDLPYISTCHSGCVNNSLSSRSRSSPSRFIMTAF